MAASPAARSKTEHYPCFFPDPQQLPSLLGVQNRRTTSCPPQAYDRPPFRVLPPDTPQVRFVLLHKRSTQVTGKVTTHFEYKNTRAKTQPPLSIKE